MSRVDMEYWRPVFVMVSRDDQDQVDLIACAFHRELKEYEALMRVDAEIGKSGDLKDVVYDLRVMPFSKVEMRKFPQEHDVLHVSKGGCEVGCPL